MRLVFIILAINLCACSTGTQIQLPEQNQNFVTKGQFDTIVNILREQISQYKNIADSLKNVIVTSTIRVDTTSASDFIIKNGIMTFNKPNLNKTIKAVVLTIPIKKTATIKKKNK